MHTMQRKHFLHTNILRGIRTATLDLLNTYLRIRALYIRRRHESLAMIPRHLPHRHLIVLILDAPIALNARAARDGLAQTHLRGRAGQTNAIRPSTSHTGTILIAAGVRGGRVELRAAAVSAVLALNRRVAAVAAAVAPRAGELGVVAFQHRAEEVDDYGPV